VLDTGANQALVGLDVAKDLLLSLEGEVPVWRRGVRARRLAVRLRRADLVTGRPSGDSRSRQLCRLPMAELPLAMGRDIDGIVGGECIQQFVIEVRLSRANVDACTIPRRFRYAGQE
jgi:hypothetical protein